MEREQLPREAQVNAEKWYQIRTDQIRDRVQENDLDGALNLVIRRKEGLQRFIQSDENKEASSEDVDNATDLLQEMIDLQAEIEEKIQNGNAE